MSDSVSKKVGDNLLKFSLKEIQGALTKLSCPFIYWLSAKNVYSFNHIFFNDYVTKFGMI